MKITEAGVFDENGLLLFDVVHDPVCGLYYVGRKLAEPSEPYGCAESLHEAVAQIVSGCSPSEQDDLFS